MIEGSRTNKASNRTAHNVCAASHSPALAVLEELFSDFITSGWAAAWSLGSSVISWAAASSHERLYLDKLVAMRNAGRNDLTLALKLIQNVSASEGAQRNCSLLEKLLQSLPISIIQWVEIGNSHCLRSSAVVENMSHPFLRPSIRDLLDRRKVLSFVPPAIQQRVWFSDNRLRTVVAARLPKEPHS